MKVTKWLFLNVVFMVYYLFSISIQIKALLIIALVVVAVASESKSLLMAVIDINRIFCVFRYKIVLNSDSKSFDGLGRVSDNQVFLTEDEKWDERPFSFKVTSIVFTKGWQ